MVFLLLVAGLSLVQVCELRILRQPCQLDGPDGAVSLFRYDDLGNPLLLRVRMVIIITIDKHYHVGILLDGSGVTQVG